MSAAAKRAKFLKAYGSEERTAWVQAQPSIVSGKGPCVNAHTRVGGTALKGPPESIVPLTWDEHQELGQRGRRTFELKYGINLDEAAKQVEARWQAHCRATTPRTF